MTSYLNLHGNKCDFYSADLLSIHIIENILHSNSPFSLKVELDARVIAAALVELSIENVNDIPADDVELPSDDDKKAKKKFLKNLSETIVDKYILKSDQLKDFIKTKNLQEPVNQIYLR